MEMLSDGGSTPPASTRCTPVEPHWFDRGFTIFTKRTSNEHLLFQDGFAVKAWVG